MGGTAPNPTTGNRVTAEEAKSEDSYANYFGYYLNV